MTQKVDLYTKCSVHFQSINQLLYSFHIWSEIDVLNFITVKYSMH